jgi:hypothetical protein
MINGDSFTPSAFQAVITSDDMSLRRLRIGRPVAYVPLILGF